MQLRAAAAAAAAATIAAQTVAAAAAAAAAIARGATGGNKAVRLTLVLRLTLQGRVLTVRLRGWALRSEGAQTAFWAQ